VIDGKTHTLGEGAFGKVFQTTNKQDVSLKVAVKVMNKEKLADQMD
jgi:calcium-dependent protein kinase